MPPRRSARVTPEPAKAKAGNGSKTSRSSKSPTSPTNSKNRVAKTRISSTEGQKSLQVIADKFKEHHNTSAPAQPADSGSVSNAPVVRCSVCGGFPDTTHVGPGYTRLTDHNKNHFHPGDIIIVQHNTNFNDEVSQENSKDFYHVGNGIVYSKMRPMVVLVTHDRHLLAVPIRTHAGRGLTKFTGKEAWYNNFFPVVQADSGYKKKANGQEPLFTSHALAPDSCIDITDVVVVHYKEWFEHSKDGNRFTPNSSAKLLAKWASRFTSAARGQEPGFVDEAKQEQIDDDGFQPVTRGKGKKT